MRNKILRLGVAALFVAASAWLSGCGGNSTPVGVIVSPVNPLIPLGGQQQFQACRHRNLHDLGDLANLFAAHTAERAADGL